jgi:hypothetical protein
MKSELTPEEQTALEAFRADAFARATSTVTDRPRAEAAICRLYELAGHQKPECIWVASPEAGVAECKRRVDAVFEPLRDALSASLWSSLSGALWNVLSGALRDALWSSVRDSRWDSLRDALSASLRSSLRVALWSSLRGSLRASLRDSLWVSCQRFPEQHLGVKYQPEVSELLRLSGDLVDACGECWWGPGWVVLCDRPTAIEIKDGKLVGMTFGGAS